MLDELQHYPVTWVSSPAGSGKTTLVASYIKARKIPVLWYRIDEADLDIASFFYYMREAARALKKGRTKPLPLLSPELRSGITSFTRHYFESLFSRMDRPGAIVFDNYQDIPEESEFHDIIKNGLKFVPEGIRIFVASREEYPSSFVSLKAESILTHMGWGDIRFTTDETREMISYREKTPVSDDLVQHIQETAQGWAAAIVLMLDKKEISRITTGPIGHSSVFDYLTIEIFEKIDDRIKDFLLKSAFLPVITPETASSLTGVEESGAILAGLCRNHYFIEGFDSEYRFHPLFKEFLMDKAKKTYKTDELKSFIIEAGRFLAESGKTEDAIILLLDVKAYNEALPLILGYAKLLLAQGRSATLEEWANKLPIHINDTTPWLSYWLGMGKFIADPTGAKRYMEKAFSLFEANKDETGCLLSVAGAINSIVLECDDYKPLDRWIKWIDKNVDAHVPLPSPDMEAFVAAAMVCAITWRMPWHPDVIIWINRTLRACEQLTDPVFRFIAKGNVVEYYGQLGHYMEMHPLAEDLRRAAFADQTYPMVSLAYMVRLPLLHDWINGSWEKTLLLIQNGICTAENMGAFYHLGSIYHSAIIAAFEMDNLEMAAEFIGKTDQASVVGKRALRLRLNFKKVFYLLKIGRIEEALRTAEHVLEDAVESGIYHTEIYARIALTYILRLTGEFDDVLKQLKKLNNLIKPLGIVHASYLVCLIEASLFLDEGNIKKSHSALAEAFRIGRIKGYAMTLFFYWQPKEMARLCNEALSAGIEVEYAKELIKKHGLVPDTDYERLKEWPWPVRIHTLGRFEIIINDKPLQPTGKIQKKPIALLKTLVSLGGKDVREEVIEDILWPDSDGDVARTVFKTTLSRLRQLLGNERIIEVKDGRISLNESFVWLDTWAVISLERSISDLRNEKSRDNKPVDELWKLLLLLMDIYKGDFLFQTDGPYMQEYRNKIQSFMTRAIINLMDMLVKKGGKEKALSLYEQTINCGLFNDVTHERLIRSMTEMDRLNKAQTDNTYGNVISINTQGG
jgi:DNA-binding SARP family transcriptional activator